jgi:hypothetical protein
MNVTSVSVVMILKITKEIQVRIISKFQDYYDSVQAFGQDQSVIFVRTNEEVTEGVRDIISDYYTYNIPKYSNPYSNSSSYFDDYYDGKYRGMNIVDSFSIFFCGERFNGIKTSYLKTGKQYLTGESTEKIIHYNKMDLDSYIDSLIVDEDTKQQFRKKKVSRVDKKLQEFFAMKSTSPDLHFRFDTPIFAIRSIKKTDAFNRDNIMLGVEKNPELKKVGFMKVKDPFAAYQELDMFISGVMGGRSPVMVEISDKDMKDKKGFYDYSFKTRPKKRLL